jgi:hypothetical protein
MLATGVYDNWNKNAGPIDYPVALFAVRATPISLRKVRFYVSI